MHVPAFCFTPQTLRVQGYGIEASPLRASSTGNVSFSGLRFVRSVPAAVCTCSRKILRHPWVGFTAEPGQSGAGTGPLSASGRAWATQLALLALGAGVLAPPEALPPWLRTLLWAPPAAAEPADMISLSDGACANLRHLGHYAQLACFP